jgi:hypothetical protein
VVTRDSSHNTIASQVSAYTTHLLAKLDEAVERRPKVSEVG